MPLSEQEQRLLDEMERHLMQNDADVVSAHAGDRALSYRNLIYGAVLLLAGVGGLIVGVVVRIRSRLQALGAGCRRKDLGGRRGHDHEGGSHARAGQ